MGKKGPCYHCGVENTPLWRNGPPEKPVLCNACGSRWRTKGSLTNYTPLHSRLDPDGCEDRRAIKMKCISLKKKDEKPNKRKLNYENTLGMDGEFTPDYKQGYKKNIDEDTSNRSSSGSAISNESCAHFGSADASDLTGPSQSVVRDALIPSWKRPCVTRPKQSSVEKLTKDLYTILHEQASQFSSSSEETLLYESEAPMVSVEIGHGSVLIRHPSSMAREEESEASSLSVDNKFCRADESYSKDVLVPSPNGSNSVNKSCSRVGDVRKLNGQILPMDCLQREKFNNEKLQVLFSHKSPLSYIDLTEIVNIDVFRGCLTDDEQQGLLKYLPSVDSCADFDSLESVFTSSHFIENLSSFQQLLAEGVLDTSFSRVKTEDCNVVKRLALSNSSKCKWINHYNALKNKGAEERISQSRANSCFAGPLISGKKFQESNYNNLGSAKATTKSSKKALPKKEPKQKGTIQNDASHLTSTPSNLFAFPRDGGNEISDDEEDLLLDVPSNSSFPQAELLCPASSFGSYTHT